MFEIKIKKKNPLWPFVFVGLIIMLFISYMLITNK